ncbi:hypothetical protein AMAG_07010 [Allomyces macrogynus ATCC 38327]|uniref:Uncharacterized protein n=1 Tax=Allomyces macrogynus (strain ATCC 38327) TaxID=578462 RepID=A0A0L0SFN6_ALLM3|nr:hypothetical protein AMAG_07010 [Allomyces macrogynus ATCC 38327]|eukprot:KNE61267.1 hypothetical protein AMAG_07010 [Allomyces macrogynus ATCC 38327]
MTNPWDTPAVRAAADTFKRLRTAPSKYSATAAGDWNKDVDTYGGAKHEAMETVRVALVPDTPHAASTTPGSAIAQLLGEPDAVLTSRDAVRALMAGGAGVSAQAAAIAGAPGPVISPGMQVAGQPGSGSTFLVYFWRGTHDYLAFEVDADGEQVKGSEWVLAGE